VLPPGEDAGEGGAGGSRRADGAAGASDGGGAGEDAGAGGSGGAPAMDAAAPDLSIGSDGAPADLPAVEAPRDLGGPDTRDVAAPDSPPGVNLAAGLVHHWKFDEGMGMLTADSSGRGNTGTLTGVPNWMSPGAPIPNTSNPFALMFDGTDDYVALQTSLSPVLGATASLSSWIKTTQTGANNSFDAPGITGVEMSSGSNDIFWGFLDAAGNLGFRPGSGTTVKSMSPVNDNMWHHVVMTRDRNTGAIQIFVDGRLTGSATTLIGDKTTVFQAIGRITNSGRPYFRGLIDDVRIWDRVITAAEVTALFTGN
jgi:hypothetical protein